MKPLLSTFSDVLTVKDLALWRGVGVKQIYRLIEEGAYDFAIVNRRPYAFSRKKLQQWADNELPKSDLVKLRRVS
jgi:hypothetical protein